MNIFYVFRQGRIMAFCFLFLFSATSLSAQTWTQTRGPGGGEVYDMAERNGTMIIGTLNGVFRSTDNGDTWHRAMNGIPDGKTIMTVTATTNYLWAGNYDGFQDLYRSANNGLSWTLVENNVGSFFISEIFGSHDTLYIGCQGCGVYRSVDEGTTFQNFNNGYPGIAGVTSFAQIGGTLFTGLGGNSGTVGVYRTSVTAANWLQMNNGLPSPASVIDLAVKGNDLLMSGGNNFSAGLFRSSNLAGSWSLLNTNVPAPEIPTKLAVSGNNIFFGTNDAPYRSADNGATFQRVGDNLKQSSTFSLFAGSGGVFLGHGRGVARTTDNGLTWQRKVLGLTVSSITSVYANDNTTLYATGRYSTVGGSDGVFSTTDGGQNWTSMDQGLLPNPQVNQILKSGSNLILATDNNSLFIKTPADAAFRRPAAEAIQFYEPVLALATFGNYIFAGIDGGIEMMRSADNGLTWAQANTGFRTDLTDQITAVYEKNGIIYAGGFDAVYKSSDLGASWTLAKTGFYPGFNVNAFTSIGNDLYAATENNGLYKSTDNGALWTEVSINVAGTFGAMKDIVSVNNTLYIANTQGVLKGANGGTSWSIMNGGLQFRNAALSITVFNNNLVLGTDQTAVWTMSLGGVLATKLTKFSAAPVNNKFIRTSFTVAEEAGISSYEVQRAPSGTNDFISIGTVVPENNGLEKSYSFDDRYAEKNVRYQYRLRIRESSGDRFSDVKTAMLTGQDVFVSVWPNPSNGILNLSLNGFSGKADIMISNAVGQVVYSKQAVLNSSVPINIDLRAFSKGVYFIKLKTPDAIISEKILIR